MKFTLRHPINTDVDTFWSKVFFDPDFNKRMFIEALGFRHYELIDSREEANGDRVRKSKMQPPKEPPAPVKKILGDGVPMEEGRFDAKTRVWSFNTIPPSLADKIKIRGTVRLEPKGDKKSERVSDIEITADIFMAGGLIEGFIEKTVRENYDKGADFINRYVAEKGL